MAGLYEYLYTREEFETCIKKLTPQPLHYGRLTGEAELLDFLDGAKTDDMETFARLAERISLNGHMQQINEFLRSYPMPRHEESARLSRCC